MTASDADPVDDILFFWFGDSSGPMGFDRAKNQLWWKGHPDDDRKIRERFAGLVERALAGELNAWKSTARGSLALVILLDQFTRCLGRGTARAFAGDGMAVDACRSAIESGLDRELSHIQRGFLYMPMMHAEDPLVAELSVKTFQALSEEIRAECPEDHPDFLSHAKGHADIVRRFGRYPHRNEALGRECTAEEQAFLDGGGPSFGQKKST